jgi:hypothetical protein
MSEHRNHTHLLQGGRIPSRTGPSIYQLAQDPECKRKLAQLPKPEAVMPKARIKGLNRIKNSYKSTNQEDRALFLDWVTNRSPILRRIVGNAWPRIPFNKQRLAAAIVLENLLEDLCRASRLTPEAVLGRSRISVLSLARAAFIAVATHAGLSEAATKKLGVHRTMANFSISKFPLP